VLGLKFCEENNFLTYGSETIAKNVKQGCNRCLGYRIGVKVGVSVIGGGMSVLEKTGVDLSKFS
jgi:hypothetical protein